MALLIICKYKLVLSLVVALRLSFYLFISGILVVFIAVPMELFQMEPTQVSISCLVKNDELISATFLPTT